MTRNFDHPHLSAWYNKMNSISIWIGKDNYYRYPFENGKLIYTMSSNNNGVVVSLTKLVMPYGNKK